MRPQHALSKETPEPTRRQMIAGVAATTASLVIGVKPGTMARGEEISRSEEAIHQEVVVNATPQRVYEALTETKQFDRVVQLSDAMKSGAPLGSAPTSISKEAGGAFAAFGGHILGRQIELVANQRIVQAWRVATWDPGQYSIARFVLIEQAGSTKLVFDHTGFPKGQADHLAAGWKSNYWEPLAKALA